MQFFKSMKTCSSLNQRQHAVLDVLWFKTYN